MYGYKNLEVKCNVLYGLDEEGSGGKAENVL